MKWSHLLGGPLSLQFVFVLLSICVFVFVFVFVFENRGEKCGGCIRVSSLELSNSIWPESVKE